MDCVEVVLFQDQAAHRYKLTLSNATCSGRKEDVLHSNDIAASKSDV